MWTDALWLASFATALAALLTGLMLRVALSTGLLDLPNARSSHSTPTPRGGGMSIVLVSVSAALFLWLSNAIELDLMAAFVVGGVAIACVGFIDDKRSVSVGIRMTIHLSAAAWAVWCLGGLGPVRFGAAIFDLGLIGHLLAVVAIAWAVNLFNFMDGIDGLAATEAVFMTLAAAGFGLVTGTHPGVSLLMLAVGAACCGFLLWNWPPARIFMGDVGSGYLGYAVGVLAIADARENSVAPFLWWILGAVFFVDATVTLLLRVIRRERVHEAHRSHAYQHLVRRWGSHRRVTVAVALLNLGWLLPCALFAMFRPEAAAWVALSAILPVVIAAVALGAWRSERT